VFEFIPAPLVTWLLLLDPALELAVLPVFVVAPDFPVPLLTDPFELLLDPVKLVFGLVTFIFTFEFVPAPNLVELVPVEFAWVLFIELCELFTKVDLVEEFVELEKLSGAWAMLYAPMFLMVITS
jgi:hypothetical protein